jgi:hypothetical protein
MKTLNLLLLSFFVVLIIACGADRVDNSISNNDCLHQEEFCSYVDLSQIDSTGVQITKALEILSLEKDTEILERLNDYLNCKDCIQKSEIICNSCFDTYPAISELRIEFISSGEITIKILDISMDDPPTYAGFHD